MYTLSVYCIEAILSQYYILYTNKTLVRTDGPKIDASKILTKTPSMQERKALNMIKIINP